MSAMGVLLARAWIWADVVVKAARRIHEQLLASILRVSRDSHAHPQQSLVRYPEITQRISAVAVS
jgi:hypothetical protein